MINQRNTPCTVITILASATLHVAVILALFYQGMREPTNNQVLQGKTASLNIHMVSAFSPAYSPDLSAAPLQPEVQSEDSLSPLSVKDRGRRPSTERHTRKTPTPQGKSLKLRTKSVQTTAVAESQSTNRGQDLIENEEGSAAQTSLLPMTGRGDDEKATYIARLRSEIESHKRFPLRAKKTRASGVVKVRFNIEDDGSLTDPVVVISSGNRDLDNSALQAVRQSHAIGPPPIGFSHTASVNIHFSLFN